MAEEQVIIAFEDALLKTGNFNRGMSGEQTQFEAFLNGEDNMDMETNLNSYVELINRNVSGWSGDSTASNYVALQHYAKHLNSNRDILLEQAKKKGDKFKIASLEKFKALFLALSLYDLNDAADIFQFAVKYDERLDLRVSESGDSKPIYNFGIDGLSFQGDDFFKYLFFINLLLKATGPPHLQGFTWTLKVTRHCD